jgi:putative FmdB family regulatory protein
VPLYDYKCTNCEHLYEVREGFDAPSRQACPSCGAVAKRVLHAPPIVFKGSGFYITDSRKGSQATLAENSRWDTSQDGDSASTGTADASSNGSKPAATASSEDSSSVTD